MNKHNFSLFGFGSRRKGKQRGISMVDIGIWAAVAIGVVLVFVKAIGPVLAQNKARDEVTEVTKVIANIQAKWSTQPSFAGITVAQLVSNGVVPTEWVTGTAAAPALTNRWGGAITIATAAVNQQLNITSAAVPTEECRSVVPGLEKVARQITVGTTVVKSPGTTVNIGSVGTACSAAATVDIIYNIGRS